MVYAYNYSEGACLFVYKSMKSISKQSSMKKLVGCFFQHFSFVQIKFLFNAQAITVPTRTRAQEIK